MNEASDIDNRYRYNGKEFQSEHGLNWYAYGARYYDPLVGRFMGVDPLADHPNQVDKSPYSAFWNNPIMYNDPDGQCPFCPWLDAVVDVGFVLYDVGVLVHEKVTTGKTSGENWAALGADGASILVPMSVGAGAAVRAGVKAVNKVDNAVDAGNAMQKLKKSAETGQEAHRQIQKEITDLDPNVKIEQKVDLKDRTVRKDFVRPDGTKGIIKPNTASGQKSAKARENLMKKNGHKTETILYDPKNPAYQKGSPTYIGPKKKIKMKLSKAKLIKLVKPSLEKLGFTEFKDSKGGWQGLFCKKLENGLYLTLGLTIHRYYDSAFTADYYLSKTTTIGAVWGDIPNEIYERPSFLLNDNERSLFQRGNVNSENSKDIWFDGYVEKSILDFLRVIELTEPRFTNQTDLMEKINQSKEVNILSNYSEKVKNIVATNQADGTYSFLPAKEVDEIPIIWFKASEKVLKESKEMLNTHTVARLAADAYRQKQLDNA